MPFWRKATNKAASESKAEKHSGRKAEAATPKSQRHTPSKRAPVGFPIVGIGASAGGLEAFTELLKRLPLDTGLGFVLVQHLDPQHESALTQILTRATLMPVREVTNNLRVEANHVYVIPPNTNLGIVQGVLKLRPRQEQGRTPHHSIDFFFESLAQDQRERAIGVILSGTATDGTLGLEAIKVEGGITFAQDDSARYDSMPRSAVAAGCVDFVLSPENIAKELVRIAKHPYVVAQTSKSAVSRVSKPAARRKQQDASNSPRPADSESRMKIKSRKQEIPGSARVSRAGESVPDEQLKQFTRRDAAPGTPEACALRISK